MSEAAAFYCVSSSEYFLGAVGMINSLRLQGHAEPVYLLDCGLTAAQRASLAGEVVVVDAPSDAPPFMLKTVAPRAHPAEVMVLIDADMIVTRSLAPLLAEAASGRVIAPRLPIERHFDEWSEPFGAATAKPGPYVTSGLVCLGGELGAEVLELMHAQAPRIELERTFLGAADPDYPFHYADQDLLNAVLASCVERERLTALDRRLVATIPFEGIELAPEPALSCRYRDGLEPYVVHHVLDTKPWLDPAPDGLYSRLLTRALFGPAAPIALAPVAVPLRLRTGALATLERKRQLLGARLRWHLTEPLAARARTLGRRAPTGTG